jgi:hypothetical protein
MSPVDGFYGEEMIDVDGILYFPDKNRIWKTKGTPEETQLVFERLPPGGGINLLGRSQTLLYFTLNDRVHGNELWALPLGNEEPPASLIRLR